MKVEDFVISWEEIPSFWMRLRAIPGEMGIIPETFESLEDVLFFMEEKYDVAASEWIVTKKLDGIWARKNYSEAPKKVRYTIHPVTA